MRIALTVPTLLAILAAAACGTAAPTEPGAVQPRNDGGNTIGSGSMSAQNGPLFDGGGAIGSGSSVGDSLGIGGDSMVVVQGGGMIGSGY